jgi:hypothetical protein
MWWSAHGELRRRENRAPRWQGLPEVEAVALGGQDARMESYIEAHMRGVEGCATASWQLAHGVADHGCIEPTRSLHRQDGSEAGR